jgi:hypothetical protein
MSFAYLYEVWLQTAKLALRFTLVPNEQVRDPHCHPHLL